MDQPVALFVHVHYPDIWQSMAATLAVRMNVPFRLLVTTSHPETDIALPQTPFLVGHQVLQVENRGRDILPFLHALQAAGPFGIGLKLHTKKSPQRKDGTQWRGAILDSLVPSGFGPGGAPGPGTGADAVVRRMQADPRIGFVTPAGFALSVADWVLVNRPAMERVMAAVGPGLSDHPGLPPASSPGLTRGSRASGDAGAEARPAKSPLAGDGRIRSGHDVGGADDVPGPEVPGPDVSGAAEAPAGLDADMVDTFFAAGSMFWFRREALAPLADPAVLSLFEPEEGQFDGTAAHAMERLFPVVAKRRGFVSLSMAGLEASRPAMPLPAVLAIARRTADLQSTYFTIPGPTPPPPAPEPDPAQAPRRSWFSRVLAAG